MKGDFFLLVILNGVKNLEYIAQLSPFTRGIWTDAFFATLNNSSDPSLSLRMTIGRVVKRNLNSPTWHPARDG